MKKISTKKAPAAIGPYSQGQVLGNLIFTSGQIALNAETGDIAGNNIKDQTLKTIENLQAILESGGSDLSKVIKTTCFLADMGDFSEFNVIYEKFFINKPARSCVAVKTLPKNLLVEIEAIAYIE